MGIFPCRVLDIYPYIYIYIYIYIYVYVYVFIFVTDMVCFYVHSDNQIEAERQQIIQRNGGT